MVLASGTAVVDQKDATEYCDGGQYLLPGECIHPHVDTDDNGDDGLHIRVHTDKCWSDILLCHRDKEISDEGGTNHPRMHIPIIGNGDINSPQKAKDYFDRYGVDAIMIGRATYGHPWIFKEIKHYLQTGELLPQMSVVDRVNLAKRHLAKSLEIKGDRVGILEMRRHLSCYFKGLPDFKETRLKLVTINDPQELFTTLDYIAERWGENEAPMAGNVYNV